MGCEERVSGGMVKRNALAVMMRLSEKGRRGQLGRVPKREVVGEGGLGGEGGGRVQEERLERERTVWTGVEEEGEREEEEEEEEEEERVDVEADEAKGEGEEGEREEEEEENEEERTCSRLEGVPSGSRPRQMTDIPNTGSSPYFSLYECGCGCGCVGVGVWVCGYGCQCGCECGCGG